MSSCEAAMALVSENHDDTTDDLVSKLPTREGWSEPLVLYKNYWLHPDQAAAIARMHLPSTCFKPRHDDTLIASSPKCGTTWMKALAFTISNRGRYELGSSSHPLLLRHPHELVPFIGLCGDGEIMEYLETLPSPRLLSTHMPLSMFPDSMARCGCRVVYVCRDPKDAFVSWWHFDNKIRRGGRRGKIDVEAGFSMFSEGFSSYGPFWEHCLEYWRESVASPDRFLFLRYEDLIAEPVKHVVKLAAFLGVPFSAEEEEDGVPEEVARLCSFEKLSSLQTNQTGQLGERGDVVFEKAAFFRKGKVGDWVNHMSEEMGRKLDCIVEEKLKGSTLVL